MTGSAPSHETFLRRAFDVAKRAHAHGNHPFGAILVDAKGTALFEVENSFIPDRDSTAHAERLLATQASKTHDPKFFGAMHAVHLGRTVRDVLWSNLLGWHRPRGLRTNRTAA